MKKKFYDIIPQEKRSIRNIPITKSNIYSSAPADQPHLEEGSIEPKDQPKDYIIEPAFETNAIEHHQQDIENFSGHIHEAPQAKARGNKTPKNMDGIKAPVASHKTQDVENYDHIKDDHLNDDSIAPAFH
jgi:hypothetical protein